MSDGANAWKSAVTVSLVSEARGGPFIFWDDLPAACDKARALGFEGVEIFAPDAPSLAAGPLGRLLDERGLKLAAVGTGAGWVRHKLTLTDADGAIRARARQFIRGMIEAGAALGAPAIIGSMQGRWSAKVPLDEAMKHLGEALNDLGEHAKRQNVTLLYEPLNRYETNLVSTLGGGTQLLATLATSNVRLLADLYHMNIEEADLAGALDAAASAIGHVHFADSNRRPAGGGHTDFATVAAALRRIGYGGYLSAEALPWPDPDAAAAQTMKAYREILRAPHVTDRQART
jgi:sugar phosphate isomerase/epimerase